jgi:hypothetical protein
MEEHSFFENSGYRFVFVVSTHNNFIPVHLVVVNFAERIWLYQSNQGRKIFKLG